MIIPAVSLTLPMPAACLLLTAPGVGLQIAVKVLFQEVNESPPVLLALSITSALTSGATAFGLAQSIVVVVAVAALTFALIAAYEILHPQQRPPQEIDLDAIARAVVGALPQPEAPEAVDLEPLDTRIDQLQQGLAAVQDAVLLIQQVKHLTLLDLQQALQAQAPPHVEVGGLDAFSLRLESAMEAIESVQASLSQVAIPEGVSGVAREGVEGGQIGKVMKAGVQMLENQRGISQQLGKIGQELQGYSQVLTQLNQSEAAISQQMALKGQVESLKEKLDQLQLAFARIEGGLTARSQQVPQQAPQHLHQAYAPSQRQVVASTPASMMRARSWDVFPQASFDGAEHSVRSLSPEDRSNGSLDGTVVGGGTLSLSQARFSVSSSPEFVVAEPARLANPEAEVKKAICGDLEALERLCLYPEHINKSNLKLDHLSVLDRLVSEEIQKNTCFNLIHVFIFTGKKEALNRLLEKEGINWEASTEISGGAQKGYCLGTPLLLLLRTWHRDKERNAWAFDLAKKVLPKISKDHIGQSKGKWTPLSARDRSEETFSWKTLVRDLPRGDRARQELIEAAIGSK